MMGIPCTGKTSCERGFLSRPRTSSSWRRYKSAHTTCKWGQGPSQPGPQLYVVEQAPLPTTPLPASTPTLMMGAVIVLQGMALIGAVVTGVLARRRREEMEQLNAKLRHINAELRRQREEALRIDGVAEEVPGVGGGGGSSSQAADAEWVAYRSTLERSLGAPAAAHPVEAFGDSKLSLAGSRRRIGAVIRAVKQQLREKEAGTAPGPDSVALPLVSEALGLAESIKDVKAQRALVRLQARALRQSGDLEGALHALERSMVLSLELGEKSGDADVFGEIGDVLTEMRDFERAGEYYDRCIQAIQDEVPQSLSSTWDCQ